MLLLYLLDDSANILAFVNRRTRWRGCCMRGSPAPKLQPR